MSVDAGWQSVMWPEESGDDVRFAPWPDAPRRHLGDGAWIDQVPGWLRSADELFEEVRATVPWRADTRQMYDSVVAVPRLTAWFTTVERWGSALGLACRDRLNEQYRPHEDRLVSAGLCLYRDGSDSVAWHGDRIGRGRSQDTIVAVLSLGSPRPFLLRPRGGGRTVRLTVGHGDLVVMGGSCQRTWEHCVPKSRKVSGPRVSVQFRPSGVA